MSRIDNLLSTFFSAFHLKFIKKFLVLNWRFYSAFFDLKTLLTKEIENICKILTCTLSMEGERKKTARIFLYTTTGVVYFNGTSSEGEREKKYEKFIKHNTGNVFLPRH